MCSTVSYCALPVDPITADPGRLLVSRLQAPRGRGRRGAGPRADRRYLYLLTGIRGETVTYVSQGLLAQPGGLLGRFHTNFAEIADSRQLGDVRVVRQQAALDLG